MGTDSANLVCRNWYNKLALARRTSPASGPELVMSFPLVDFMQMTSDVLFNPQSFFRPDDKEVAGDIAVGILTHDNNREAVKKAILDGSKSFLLFLIDAYNNNRSFFNKVSRAFGKNSQKPEVIQYIEDWSNPPKE
jgi:hypothetical protein